MGLELNVKMEIDVAHLRFKCTESDSVWLYTVWTLYSIQNSAQFYGSSVWGFPMPAKWWKISTLHLVCNVGKGHRNQKKGGNLPLQLTELWSWKSEMNFYCFCVLSVLLPFGSQFSHGITWQDEDFCPEDQKGEPQGTGKSQGDVRDGEPQES